MSYHKFSRQLYLEWINSLNTDKKSKEEQVAASKDLRQKGNLKFNTDNKKYALLASRFYTEAIIAAPPNSEYIALAHANRTLSLQAFGYFRVNNIKYWKEV